MTRLLPASALQVLGATERQLRIDAVLPVQARQTGWLQVVAGQAWITRSGDAADHVLAAGDAVALGRGQQLVVEPWKAGQVVQLRWLAGAALPVVAAAAVPAVQVPVLRPLPAAARPAGAGLVWRTLAWALRGAAARLAAAARSAESRASAAQGRICAGDSIAASGALQ
jgi:Protein of unknown function (DUF2917)